MMLMYITLTISIFNATVLHFSDAQYMTQLKQSPEQYLVVQLGPVPAH